MFWNFEWIILYFGFSTAFLRIFCRVNVELFSYPSLSSLFFWTVDCISTVSPEVNKKIHCLKFILFSLGSDIGFSMFTLRENLDGFLKEVEVGFVLYFRCVSILDKCAIRWVWQDIQRRQAPLTLSSTASLWFVYLSQQNKRGKLKGAKTEAEAWNNCAWEWFCVDVECRWSKETGSEAQEDNCSYVYWGYQWKLSFAPV